MTPDLGTFPVLHRAYKAQIKIDRPWVEMPSGEENPAQIFRVPFRYKRDHSNLQQESDGALERAKAELEQAFIYGSPKVFGAKPLAFATLGGTRHWLGRDLEPSDEIALAVLRPLTVRLAVGEHDLFNDYVQTGEWITEVSLWVKPANQEDEQ